MKHFTPTFLYIKRHSITGLQYFGKTIKNPEKYHGSGVHWKNHLNKYGREHVETIWYCLFVEKEELIKFAEMFSEQEDIVKSSVWANLIIENGLDGAQPGHASYVTNHEEVSRKISEANLLAWQCPIHRERVIQAQKDSWTDERRLHISDLTKLRWTPEARLKHSAKMKGKPGTKKLKGIPKTAEHNRKNSEALKGRVFSEEHRKNLSQNMRLRKVCRLCDRKVMSVTHFTRWLNSLSSITTNSIPLL